MKKALIKIHNQTAGILYEYAQNHYVYEYIDDYIGQPISLTMPVSSKTHEFACFPPFFDGLLPEGIQLEAILKRYKIDKQDLFEQLLITGSDLVGAVTVEGIGNNSE